MPERKKGHIPIRTCVACKERAPQADMIRLVKNGDGLVMDMEKRFAGRGHYLHAQKSCISLLADPKKINRAFRVKLPEPKRQELISRIHERILGESDGQNAGL